MNVLSSLQRTDGWNTWSSKINVITLCKSEVKSCKANQMELFIKTKIATFKIFKHEILHGKYSLIWNTSNLRLNGHACREIVQSEDWEFVKIHWKCWNIQKWKMNEWLQCEKWNEMQAKEWRIDVKANETKQITNEVGNMN